jgi:hypothetical protein
MEPAHQRNLDKFVSNHYPDSPEHVMADWFATGLYSGIGKSEWAQQNNHIGVRPTSNARIDTAISPEHSCAITLPS